MQLNSKTGPYLLMAGGAALLAGALFSFKLPLLLGGAVFLGLGFWALRRLDLSLFMRGYILLGASAAVIAVAAVFSASALLFIVALALAGLGFYTFNDRDPY